jgi:cellulose synthase operon protein C
MQRISLAVMVASALAIAGEASADLDRGSQYFLRGDYEAARASFERVRGERRPHAQLALGRLEVRRGALADAEARVQQLTSSSQAEISREARVLLAEIYWRTGRLDEARRELEPIAAARESLRGRYLLGRIYRDLGRTDRAEAMFGTFFTDWNTGRIDHDDAEALMYVALAARYLSSFQDANDTFRDAVTLQPELLEANIEWGHLFLDKYAAGHAEQSFDEVLQINPRHPDAHAGMAQVKLEQSYDVAAAQHHLEQAFAVNPRHVPSLLIRAGLEIDRNQWDAAHASLDEVLAVNPKHLRGRALRATIHWLRDEMEDYARLAQEILADHPTFAELYHTVARSAVREHRYRQAIELEKQAVALDPSYYKAMQAIGTGYLRLGHEEEGLTWLNRAWEGDQYNVRTFNTLELFEETIPEQYSFARSEHFVFRYHNDEKPILRRYVEPLVERAYADMVRRYGFEPEGPIIIELFRNPQDYSVRTIGLPNLGALGVCFGRVITAVSPTGGDLNWAMVLWHELSHVFAIQMSDSRVPRWYTEGLSEYETIRARPEWRRANDGDVYAALEGGTLPSVVDLNHGFMNPDRRQVVVSYHLSAIVIEYLATHYGFDKVVHGLELFGEGLETPEVLARIAGTSVDALDEQFRGYLRERLAPYGQGFQLPVNLDDVSELAEAARTRADDAEAYAHLALGHFYDGDAAAAAVAAKRALELDPQRAIALYVAAELELRSGNVEGARAHYQAMLAAGADNVDVRARLGWIAAQAGELEEAERQLCAAKRLAPERSYPYQALYELYRQAGRTEDALRELEGYVMIEQMRFGPAKRLAEGYARLGNWEKARTYGELARNINPTDGDLLLTLGRAYLHTGAPSRAHFSFESALVTRPEIRRPALAHLGSARALLDAGKPAEAREAAERALAVEPDNDEARALLDELVP